MASILLSSVASSVGLGGAFGKLAGSFIGRSIDSQIFGGDVTHHTHSHRLKDFSIQSSSYGSMIPIIYGTVKIAGNIIWAKNLKEKTSTSNASTRTKGGRINRSNTEYTYFASLAISICEGPIDEIIRVWADDRVLDLSLYNIRIYKGGDEQLPDPLIEAHQGIGNTPAYRGQAYVVLEDFPLAEFGNRLPNFNFEVKRNVKSHSTITVEDKIESIVMIPGGGEFVYDTIQQNKINGNKLGVQFAQAGASSSINQHTHCGKPNSLVSLDQLKSTLPNVKWISVVVNWFGTSLNAGDCKIMPGVEFKEGATTAPDVWEVCGQKREDAHLISKVENKPNYGGTINDASLVRYLKELKERGYKIMLCPMVFMDLPGKPWRGYVTGDSDDINKFFEENGYNKFIQHYALLSKGLVDAFLIGSELIGITKVCDENKNFTGVERLEQLATDVKKIVDDKTKVSYGADWSEYHHTECGWYNLDKLWASPSIDFIGIDAYFPLTNANESTYEINKIVEGWQSGEGFDFCFEDKDKKNKSDLPKEYAWKNISWWWENEHINPDGYKTSWSPKSKKIWFTEYGFPSVDCASNQPNVFFDETTKDSAYPIHSKGTVDFKAQRAAIEATELFWENSEIVENIFLWCWDARPYPYWPDAKKIWSDGSAYIKGHWVQGKLGTSRLSEVISDLSKKCLIEENQVNASSLTDSLDGLIIDSKRSVRSVLELLRTIYFFDVIEKDGKIIFEKRGDKSPLNLENIKDDFGVQPEVTKADSADLPSKVDINFINSTHSYKAWNRHSLIHTPINSQSYNLNLPVVISESYAASLADIVLNDLWQNANQYHFELPPKYCYLSIGDLISVIHNNKKILLRIISIHLGSNLVSKITALADDPDIYKSIYTGSNPTLEELEPLSKTCLEILDIPYIEEPDKDSDLYIYLAACGYAKNWDGAKIFISNEYSNYEEFNEVTESCVLGTTLTKLGYYPPSQIDLKNKVIVSLISGELETITSHMMLSGYNKALIGNEIIFFKEARLIAPFQYELSHFIRGMYGTEDEITSHLPGERFILLDSKIKKIKLPSDYIGSTYKIKAVTFNDTLDNSEEIIFNLKGECLKTYNPVNVKIDGKNVSWDRRTRIHSFMPNYSDVPLGEMFERYIVESFNEQGVLLETLETDKTCVDLTTEFTTVIVTQVSSYI